MERLERIVVWIVGHQYLGIGDEFGLIYINLTPNDVIISRERFPSVFEEIEIPQSGHIAYVIGNKIVGLPPKTDNICLVVKHELFSLLKRDDLLYLSGE